MLPETITNVGKPLKLHSVGSIGRMLEAEGASISTEMLEGIFNQIDTTNRYSLIVSGKPEGVECHLRLRNISDASSAFGVSCVESTSESMMYGFGVELGEEDQYGCRKEAKFDEKSPIVAIIRSVSLCEETGCPDSGGVSYRIVVYAPTAA